MQSFYYGQGNNEDLQLFQKELVDTYTHKQIKEDNIYLDTIKEEKWQSLKNQLQKHDKVYISSIGSIAMDTNDFKKKLLIFNKLDIKLLDINGNEYQIKQILDTLAFLNDRGLYIRKQKQREGIQKALRQKELGKGRYGRPKTIVPEDFEENIRKVMKKQMRHETYRQKLNMKRSTYFKLVKDLKASWLQKG